MNFSKTLIMVKAFMIQSIIMIIRIPLIVTQVVHTTQILSTVGTVEIQTGVPTGNGYTS